MCDHPGTVLCTRCLRLLPYLDPWRACPRCGAAFGRVQCTECNPVMMAAGGLSELPFASCTSALMFDASTARIPRAYKDHGVKALAPIMAQLMDDALMPEWKESCQALTFVPATKAAVRRRGFDHTQELAQELSARCGLPIAPLLARPRSTDQRGLSRSERFANMRRVFQEQGRGSGRGPAGKMQEDSFAPLQEVLLMDDVMTTGATLFAAASALRAQGVERVRCVTFLRV
ncbi:MAG: phosphoribosyltransferase family protein [Coriobacteriia bacterium]|nr:phosphoribosyltransferase family protein [Coriobacteriia bacterium]